MQYKSEHTLFIFILLVFLGFSSCRSPREVSTADLVTMGTADMALLSLHSSQPEFEWLGTRFSGSALWEGRTQSIAGSLRIRKDSAIYVSVAPLLGIELVRALVTPDSIKVINRLESTYYTGNINSLNKLFNADVDFYMLQALLTASDFPHFRHDQFMLAEESPFLTLHATQRHRKNGQGTPITQSIMIEPSSMRIRTNIMEQKAEKRALRADYKKYQYVGGQWMPNELELFFSDHDVTSRIDLAYNRTVVNEPQRIQFSVPSRYTVITLD